MYYSYPQQTFQEVPGEITLALSISGCPLRCIGCHSMETYPTDFGKELTIDELDNLIKKFKHTSCVLFYGGEWNLSELKSMIKYVRELGLKICLYTGNELSYFSKDFLNSLNFIKVGPYIKEKGNLSNPKSNQKFYDIGDNELTETTFLFRK